MTDSVEDLLTRTLRDPGRALPIPADPVPAIRRRARTQRRNTALGLAAVVLVVAATLLGPAAVGRFTRPVPVATEPAPRGSGLLDWPASGPLAGDTRLVQDAVGRWRRLPDAGPTGPVRLVWAGRVGDDRVVLLQGPGAHGVPVLVEVGDRSGSFVFLRLEPVGDPGAAALRLKDPVAGTSDRTLLLPRPGAGSVLVLTKGDAVHPVPAGGVVILDGARTGDPVAVLDHEDRVLASGLVPGTERMPLAAEDVRLTTATWDSGRGVRRPKGTDLAAGQVLRSTLDPAGTEPVEVGVIADDARIDLPSGHQAQPRFYEVHRAGRTYLGRIVWVGDLPYCEHLDDVRDLGLQEALILRCALPAEHTGIVYVLFHNGLQGAGLRIDAARPGQQALAPDWSLPVRGSFATELPHFPTGPGLLRLENDDGSPRPTIRLPAYAP
jgi:hypothetical protein